MSRQDPSKIAALDSAADLVRATAGTVISSAPTLLLEMMRAATTYRERSQLALAQNHLLLTQEPLTAAFSEALREKIDADLQGDPAAAAPVRPGTKTDWSEIGLVGEDQIQEDISFGRIGQFITHECDAELRELASYMSALLRHGRADPERNPVRGAVIGWAMHRAIEKVTPDVVTERVIARELGLMFAKAMRGCYADIVTNLRARGVRPAELVARPIDAQTPRPVADGVVLSEEAVKNWERSLYGRLVVDAGDARGGWQPTAAGGLASSTAAGTDAGLDDPAGLLDRLVTGAAPAALIGNSPLRQAGSIRSDEELTLLVRRLNQTIEGVHGRLRDSALVAKAGLVTNAIREHRDVLEKASTGKLDHMVIEVVSSLFDQILSDPQVPTHMARQIARLQLPVLRVAMRDPDFFASRGHPVRRFINRVSSLGMAMDDFENGPGKEFLDRVRELIQQIVDGDFQEIDLYGEKLLELERFTAEQARNEIKSGAAAETLQRKEIEWRQLNRFSELLRSALEPLPLDTYLKAFLSQTWSQVIVTASLRDSADSPAAQRFRTTGCELAASVQPKRSVDDRKRFISLLPKLMSELNEGMAMVEWPAGFRNEFFERLVASHAGSLKTVPASELDHNLLLKRLESIFRTPIPRHDETATTPPPLIRTSAFEQRFSPDEAASVGLIGEAAVDWSQQVEPDPAAEATSAEASADAVRVAVEAIADADEPAVASTLRDHLQIGFSYRLYLSDHWEKIRLTYMSPARNFFLFTHGSKGRGSISMTARMLDRLCETQRMRAFETAYLVDRATERARQQLAALATQRPPAAIA